MKKLGRGWRTTEYLFRIESIDVDKSTNARLDDKAEAEEASVILTFETMASNWSR